MHGAWWERRTAQDCADKRWRRAKQQNIAQKDKVEGKESEEDFTRVRHLSSDLSFTFLRTEFSKHERTISIDEFRYKVKNNTSDYDVHG